MLPPSPVESNLQKALRLFLLFALSFVALVYVWSSLAAIFNFYLEYPAYDEFRTHRFYLEKTFPANAIQLENGHRPILPALVRIVQLEWFAGATWVSVVAGLSAIVLLVGTLLRLIWRDARLSLVARMGLTVATTVFVFWLGNSRMLVHPHELVHTYFVVMFMVFAVLASIKAGDAVAGRATFWAWASGLLGIAATFSFGTGLAAFVAVFLMSALRRSRIKVWVIQAALFAVTVFLYLGRLPGDSGVRRKLTVDVFENATIATQWLAAPWVRAWFGNAEDASFRMISKHSEGVISHAVVDSATWLNGMASQETWAWMVGALGLLWYTVIVVRAWLMREQNKRVLIGLGVSAFAVGAAGIVSLARLAYFHAKPAQLFADRYLPWSCLFWLGLIVASHPRMSPNTRGRALVSGLFVFLAAVVFWPSHKSMTGWDGVVHTNNMQAAVAAQMGVWDPERSSPKSAASDKDAHTTLAILKARKQSMYAELGAELWAQRDLPASALRFDGLAVAWKAKTKRVFHDVQHDQETVLFEGYLPKDTKNFDDATLVVLNEHDHIVGLAKRSYFLSKSRSFRFDMPQKRGIHGYVLNPQWGAPHRLVLVQPNREVVYSLGFVLQKPES